MIVITGAMMASAAIAGGGTALSAFGDYQKNRAALKRARKQRKKLEKLDREQFQRDTKNYWDYVTAQGLAYAKDLENLDEQYELNAIARQRSIESGLTQLADISDSFVQKAFARGKRLAESTGKAAASGMTGVTADRFDRVQRGQAAMNTATDRQSMERAVGSFIFREAGARMQQMQADQNAYRSVGPPPMFGPPPVAPQKRARMADYSGRDLAFGLGKAVFNGIGAGLAKAPETPFQDPATEPASLPPRSIAAAASGPFPSYGLSPAMTGSVSGSIFNMYRPGMTDFGALTGINSFI